MHESGRYPWGSGYLRGRHLMPNPTPFTFEPDNMDFWEIELQSLMKKYSIIIFQDGVTGDYEVRGEGVRLRIPMRWLVTIESQGLVYRIISGIHVSRAYRDQLGY